MATWNSGGLRGSTLEEFVNRTNDRYSEMGLALIQKIPTPITPVQIDQEHRHITLAYFDKASTVDYIGAVQGIPLCFDAKECHDTKWHMQKKDIIQTENLKHCKNAGCEAFFLIYFFPTKQLVKVDVDEVINVLQQGSKTVGAEKGGEFNIGLIIDKAANELH